MAAIWRKTLPWCPKPLLHVTARHSEGPCSGIVVTMVFVSMVLSMLDVEQTVLPMPCLLLGLGHNGFLAFDRCCFEDIVYQR